MAKLKNKEIIKKFLEKHPEIKRAEWLAQYEDLTFWFNDSFTPDEPFCKTEFKRGSDTWQLFEELEEKLIKSGDKTDADVAQTIK